MKDNITYLDIPFSDKDEAIRIAGKLKDGSNALGFDRENKVWFAKKGADLIKLSRWLPLHEIEADPQAEFRIILEGAGFILKHNPIMDGKIHRVHRRR